MRLLLSHARVTPRRGGSQHIKDGSALWWVPAERALAVVAADRALWQEAAGTSTQAAIVSALFAKVVQACSYTGAPPLRIRAIECAIALLTDGTSGYGDEYDDEGGASYGWEEDDGSGHDTLAPPISAHVVALLQHSNLVAPLFAAAAAAIGDEGATAAERLSGCSLLRELLSRGSAGTELAGTLPAESAVGLAVGLCAVAALSDRDSVVRGVGMSPPHHCPGSSLASHDDRSCSLLEPS